MCCCEVPGVVGAGAPAITSVFAYVTPAWRQLRFWGSAGCPPSLCEHSLPYKSSPYKLLPPQNTTLVSLACTILYRLDTQHNHTSLYYFPRLYWPQFASLQLFLPSFLRISSVIAFQFLFITSRCTAITRILTTIQTSLNPLNSTDPKTFSKCLQLPLSPNRAFSRRIAVFCDRVTARAARCCCTHVTHVLPPPASVGTGGSILIHFVFAPFK